METPRVLLRIKQWNQVMIFLLKFYNCIKYLHVIARIVMSVMSESKLLFPMFSFRIDAEMINSKRLEDGALS